MRMIHWQPACVASFVGPGGSPRVVTVAYLSTRRVPTTFRVSQTRHELERYDGGKGMMEIRSIQRARLDREFARYASSNRSLMATMKVIREALPPVCGADLLCMARRAPPFEHI